MGGPLRGVHATFRLDAELLWEHSSSLLYSQTGPSSSDSLLLALLDRCCDSAADLAVDKLPPTRLRLDPPNLISCRFLPPLTFLRARLDGGAPTTDLSVSSSSTGEPVLHFGLGVLLKVRAGQFTELDLTFPPTPLAPALLTNQYRACHPFAIG